MNEMWGERAVVYSSQTIRVDYLEAQEPQKSPVILTFTPLSVGAKTNLNGLGYAGTFLLKRNLNVLSIKTVANDWYRALPGRPIAAMRAFLADSRFEGVERAAYGSSMGAYAAIKFSNELELDRVLALSPQVSITMAQDRRWGRFAGSVGETHGIVAGDIRSGCRYMVMYDPHDADRLHIDYLSTIIAPSGLIAMEVPFAGHPVADFLSETGQLKAVALNFLGKGEVRPIDRKAGRRQSSVYYYNLANRALKTGHVATALDLIEAAIRLNPKRALFYRLRSMIALRCGRIPEGVEAARAAVKLEPNGAYALKDLALALIAANEFEEALTVIDRAIENEPRATNFYPIKSKILLQSGSPEAAISSFEQALAIDFDAAILSQLCRLLYRERNFEACIANVTRLLEVEPKGYSNWLLLGRANFHLGRLAEAVEAAERSVALASPRIAEPVLFLADLHEQRQQPEAAAAALRRATERGADDADIYLRLIDLLRRIGDFAGADTVSAEVARKFPNMPIELKDGAPSG